MTYEEALWVVFPLLNARDLASCLQVCKQWRDIARDDYLWKCLCAKRWPSFCKKPIPPPVSYCELFQKLRKRNRHKVNIGPTFSLDDLEFYIDVWDVPVDEERLVFSEVIPGSVLRSGLKDLPPDVSEVDGSYLDIGKMYSSYLDGSGYKIIIPVEPKFCFLYETLRVSLLICRRDTNKLACIFEKLDFFFDKDDEENTVSTERVPSSILRGNKELPCAVCEMDESCDECEMDESCDVCEMDEFVHNHNGRGWKRIIAVKPKFRVPSESVIITVPAGLVDARDLVCILEKSELDHGGYQGFAPGNLDITQLPDLSDVRIWISFLFMEDKYVEDWEEFVAGIALDFGDAVIDETDFLALLGIMLEWH